MKTLFAKILLWLLATIVITTAGFVLIDAFNGPASNQRRGSQFFMGEARHIYAAEGAQGLSSYFERIKGSLGGRAFLIDSSGTDLVSGNDRSNLIRQAKNTRLPFVHYDSSFFFYGTDRDGYWFFVEIVVMSGAWIQRLWLLATILALCYLLARHLTSPLRGLQHAVERFGKGDFTARSNSQRRDELGQLARTFDQMAERIQTLLENQRELLRDISHELRSPLTRLGLAIELARSRADKEKALNTIEKEADRLNELVGELLSLARLENQEFARPCSPIRLDEMVIDLIDACSVEASQRKCRLLFPSSGQITVDADEELIRRAIENIIRNAVRYAPENTDIGVTIEETDGMTILRVRDAGPGVPQDSLTRIFEPFYRVDHDRNRETGGTGLGLAIAHRAVQIHGGRILARNAHPGLEVEIQLPRSGPLVKEHATYHEVRHLQ
jgi:signal transduction histidine kinase